MIGRNPSRNGNGPHDGGNREIVEGGLREFGGSQLALGRRGLDAAIALTVEMRACRGRRVRHAVMRVVAGWVRLVDGGQLAGTHRTGPSHGNGEGGCDDWLPIAHKAGRIRLLRVAVKLSSGPVLCGSGDVLAATGAGR